MAEVVAFDESPLGEYLREIGAGEALVVEDPLAVRHVAATDECGSGTAAAAGHPALAALLCGKVACMLAESGHLAERFTPVRPRQWAAASRGIPLDSVAARPQALRDTAGRTAVPLAAAAGLLLMQRRLLPGRGLAARAGAAVSASLGAVAAALGAVAAALAAACLWRQVRAERAVRQANAFIERLHSAQQSWRALDAAVHRALRTVHEVEFVSRGFRLPSTGAPPGMASRLGRGTLAATQRTRTTVAAALDRATRALVAAAREAAGAPAALLDAAADAHVHLEAAGDPALGALRATFDLHFGLRRLWLASICEQLEHLARAPADDARLRRTLRATARGIERVRAAAVAGLDELARARDAQYAVGRWESLAAAAPGGGGGHAGQPLQRALGGMADVLGALQAKVLVCRQCVGADGEDGSEEAAEDDTPEHVARVFASLKADIDMLNAHYQDAVTRLLCADAAPDVCASEGVSSGSAVAAMAMDDAEAMVGDARVFELTMLSADAMDAPDLAFEADAESTQQRPRPAQTAARSDRIRQQRERRAEEAAVRERRGDITTMMAELRSAVGTRAKGAMDASGGPAT